VLSNLASFFRTCYQPWCCQVEVPVKTHSLVFSALFGLAMTGSAIAQGMPSVQTTADPSTPPCSREKVKALVCHRSTPYDPGLYPPVGAQTYVAPACNPASDTEATAIGNAYDIAPWKVKAEICKLSKIVIQDGDAYDWGFWENPETKSTNGSRPNSYVGLRSDRLNKTLASQLDSSFSLVFEITSAGFSPTHTVTNDSMTLGLLYVLAHELGHIKWHRDRAYSSLSCYYDAFVKHDARGKSWLDNTNLANFVRRRWHPGPKDPNAGGTGTDKASHRSPNAPDPHQSNLNPGQVRNLYRFGFMTALAGISPEEDLVETYALLTALHRRNGSPPTITLAFRRGGSSESGINIPTQSSELDDKTACVEREYINFQ
jgi:hypothetical protein